MAGPRRAVNIHSVSASWPNSRGRRPVGRVSRAVFRGEFSGEDGDAGRDPDAILRRWTRQGWVHRSIDHETRTERYQLTAGAHQAVQQIRNVRRHSSTAPQSALAMVMTELRQIAVEASPDPQQRAAALREQIAALEAQLAACSPGKPFQRPRTSSPPGSRPCLSSSTGSLRT
jgi:hypothetical protein